MHLRGAPKSVRGSQGGAARLSVLVFLGFFLVVGLGAVLLLNTFTREVRPGVRQGMETALVDTANLLAELAAEDLKAGILERGAFAQAVARFRERRPNARIWGVGKGRTAFRVYVTDAAGVVVFDSSGEAVGQDYSRWNDVYLTLRGQYGARSSPRDVPDPVMHVAAPVLDGTRILGVLTVADPTAAVLPHAQRSERKVLLAGGLLLGTALAVGVALSWWLTVSIGRLRAYARDVAEGRRTVRPEGGSSELRELGRALETMRERLEGRRYVERTIQALAHEMKTPLSAIRGAAELLDEELPEATRQRFHANLRDHEARLRQLIDGMLELSRVEHLQALPEPRSLDLDGLLARVAEGRRSLCEQRGLTLETRLEAGGRVVGEAFLLEHAFANLLDNAIAFSPEGGRILLRTEALPGRRAVSVEDEGPGVPDYALPKVFEPFYSLPRPDTGRKSTGLGLSFVKEVAELHGGSVRLENRPGGGAAARLDLPA